MNAPQWHWYALAMLGSGLGGGARLWVATAIAPRAGSQFPWGTLLVNVTGCLLVGMLGAAFATGNRLHASQDLRVFLMVGVLGGFTTFSAFGLETVQLAQRGAVPQAVAYALASVVSCVAAAWIGYAIAAAALR